VNRLVFVVGLAALALSVPSAQTPQFRAGTDTVPVYVTVRDPQRGFVLDLTQDDFEVRDEGRVQTITQFTTDRQPLSSVVMIDGSGSMMGEFNRAIEGANNFILRMLPDDRARIGSFADKVVLGPRFTSDRDELLAYVEDQFNLRVGGETHLWEGLLEGARALAGQPGKRVVVALSDGYNFVLPPGYGKPQTPAGPGSGRPPIGTGPGGNPIGLGGRNPMGGTIPNGPTSRLPPGMGGGGSIGDPARNGVSIEQARSAALSGDVILYAVSMWTRGETSSEKPNHDLEQLAIDTGGAFFQVRQSDDMNTTFTEIVQQLRQQYVLGFTPKEFDGKRHKLEVRVKRRGVDVQARKSYVATRERGQEQ
jgi:VWFA-related protein